jgi:hypothetical protein
MGEDKGKRWHVASPICALQVADMKAFISGLILP